jgi:RimJ/RimL family protein N-acetyltransferase
MDRGAAMIAALSSLPAVPVLLTPRLELRGHRVEDLPDSVAMWADPEIVRYIGGKPNTEEEVWARFLRYVGHWTVMGFGYWVIVERASGRFVGEVGFGDARREIQPPWGPVMETGWALVSWAHGQGIASEAVKAVLEWADERRPHPRIVCMIDPPNLASRRVAEKCGFVEYAQGSYKGETMLLLERVMPSRA